MTYQVRAKRHDEGGYTLSYGKGGRKIELRAVNPDGRGWRVLDAPPDLAGVHTKLSDLKSVFEKWAAGAYDGGEPLPDDTSSGPPAFKRSSGPPAFKRQGDVRSGNQYQCDPLDPAFFTASPDRELTPLGALDQVWSWVSTHIDERKHDVYPWADVAVILRRKFPDRIKYQEPVLRKGD